MPVIDLEEDDENPEEIVKETSEEPTKKRAPRAKKSDTIQNTDNISNGGNKTVANEQASLLEAEMNKQTEEPKPNGEVAVKVTDAKPEQAKVVKDEAKPKEPEPKAAEENKEPVVKTQVIKAVTTQEPPVSEKVEVKIEPVKSSESENVKKLAEAVDSVLENKTDIITTLNIPQAFIEGRIPYNTLPPAPVLIDVKDLGVPKNAEQFQLDSVLDVLKAEMTANFHSSGEERKKNNLTQKLIRHLDEFRELLHESIIHINTDKDRKDAVQNARVFCSIVKSDIQKWREATVPTPKEKPTQE